MATVAAAIGVLAMSIIVLYSMAYVAARNTLAASARQEAQVGQAPRVPEMVSAYIYNVSLCHLLRGKLTPKPWKLLVVNTGNTPVEVDSIVASIGTSIIFQDGSRRALLPGQYFVASLLIQAGANPELLLAQIHTVRGGLFLGGYGVPPPESAVTVDGQGRCLEP